MSQWLTIIGLLCALGLSSGCQNPVRDPIDSVVDRVTTDRQEITKLIKIIVFDIR